MLAGEYSTMPSPLMVCAPSEDRRGDAAAIIVYDYDIGRSRIMAR